MAAAKKSAAPAPAAGAKPPKKRGNKLRWVTGLIILGFAAPFIMPTLVLLGVGLLPALVALVVDRDPEHSATAAIGSMNAAGLAPFLLDLWIKGQTMPNALHIMKDTTSWLVILGAAGIGQLIVFAVPSMMANLTLLRAEGRLKILRANLDQLKTGWGGDVANAKPLDQIVKN